MSTKTETKKWYVGTMNDALFIINEPPRPAPKDYHNPNLKTKVIAALGEHWSEGFTHAEVASHANLLAAAPELLEALQDMVGSYPMGTNPNCDKAAAKARAAIRKAQGDL